MYLMNHEVFSNWNEGWGLGGEKERGLEKRAGPDGGGPRCQGRRPDLTLGSLGYCCKIPLEGHQRGCDRGQETVSKIQERNDGGLAQVSG